MTPWWAALAPVTLPVPCGEQNHELHWAEGTLTAPAHPDAHRERALAALGADPSPCVQILDAWNRLADDLDVLLLASRGPADLLDETSVHFASHGPAHAGFTSYGPLTHATRAYASRLGIRSARMGWSGSHRMSGGRYADDEDESPADTLMGLLNLGSGLPHRLAATVIATWAERIDAGDERVAAATPALDAALYGRVAATFLPWLAGPAKIQFTMLPPDGAPAIRRDADAIHAELPFAWLRDVWANGFAVTLDRFCVRADQTAPQEWTLTTVDRDLTAPRTLTIGG